MVFIPAFSIIRLHMFHYFADFCNEFELLFLSDVMDEAPVNAMFILSKDKPLKHTIYTF